MHPSPELCVTFVDSSRVILCSGRVLCWKNVLKRGWTVLAASPRLLVQPEITYIRYLEADEYVLDDFFGQAQ